MFRSILADLFATQLRVLNPIRHLYLYVAAFSLPSSFVVSLFLQNKFNLHSFQSLQPMLAKYIVNRTHISLENEKQSTKDGRNYSLHLQASVKHWFIVCLDFLASFYSSCGPEEWFYAGCGNQCPVQVLRSIAISRFFFLLKNWHMSDH